MRLRLCSLLLLIGFAFSTSVFAQKYEVNPYGGYYWPGNNDGVGEFKNNQVLGVRGGVYVSPNTELGANWAWSNHFQPTSGNAAAAFAGSQGFEQGKARERVLEAEFTYHFGDHKVLGHSFRPYVVVGTGALTTRIKDDEIFVLNVRPFTKPCGCIGYAANDVMEGGDHYFTFSYGGGLKATRVWGPMGFFGDFRGLSIPNFFGHGTNWPELSAGLTFSWGER